MTNSQYLHSFAFAINPIYSQLLMIAILCNCYSLYVQHQQSASFIDSFENSLSKESFDVNQYAREWLASILLVHIHYVLQL